MKNNRGLGCVEMDRPIDGADRFTTRHVCPVYGAPAVEDLPKEHSIAGLAMPGCDQGVRSSCTGYGSGQALYIRQKVLFSSGDLSTVVWPSPMAIYAGGRARRHGPKNLADVGANPVDVWYAVKETGVVSNDLFPETSNVNAMPAARAYAALPAKKRTMAWMDYLWIPEGSGSLVEVKRMLVRGRPVAMAFQVDDGFMEWSPKDGPWERRGESIGGHYVCAVGYEGDNVWCVNSHGSGYGDHGFVLVSGDELESGGRYMCTPDIHPSAWEAIWHE